MADAFSRLRRTLQPRENPYGLTHDANANHSFSSCADMHHGEGHWNGSLAAPDGPLGSHSSKGDNISDIKQIWLTWTQQLHMQNFCTMCTYSPVSLHFFQFSLKKKKHPFRTWKTSLEVLFVSLSDHSIYYTMLLPRFLSGCLTLKQKSSKSSSKEESNGWEL